MKKIVVSVLLIAVSLAVFGQKPPAPKPAPKPAPPVLKTTLDTISYILGESAGYNLSQQGFGTIKLNMSLFNRGMADIMGKKTPLIDDGTANNTINRYYMQMQQEKSKTEIEAGEKFLAKNKTRPEVKTTESGLQYEILRNADGPHLTAVDTFVCHYRGTLLNGTEFDASYNRGQPLVMAANQVIRGWTEGLQLMPVGSKFKFYIPYQLGYGVMGQGQIPGGAMLIFEVELLDIKKKAQ